MSSGNPFRRSHVRVTSNDSTIVPVSAEDRFPEIEQIPPSDSASKTKKVRITSPPHSPPHPASPQPESDISARLSTGHHAGSPPPSVSGADLDSAGEDSASDAESDTDKEDSAKDENELLENAEGKQQSLGQVKAAPKPPSNPFQKTLATLEPSGHRRIPSEEKAGGERSPAAERSAGHAARNPMDVDSFTKMLMTGSTAPPPSVSAHAGASVQRTLGADSSSSTDTSSVSRQSLFEPVQEPHPESPRTSYEIDVSDDDDRANLTGDLPPATPKKDKKKPPPPAPKHRHGKLVSSRAPQTVSFNDFSTSAQSTPRPEPPSSSTFDKPLPPPPISSTPASPLAAESTSTSKPLPLSPQTSSSDSLTPQNQKAKTPPAPPISRRHSQLIKSPTRAPPRSRSNTGSSSHPPSIAESITSTSTKHPPPPPPPARRHGNSIGKDASAYSALKDVGFGGEGMTQTPETSRRSSRSSIMSPPPVPSRRASQSQRSPPATGGAPEPPPRRRGSSRSSMDTSLPVFSGSGAQRASGEYAITSDGVPIRTETIESFGEEVAVQSPTEGVTPSLGKERATSDILDDMERFQREVDQLRERAQREAS